MPVNKIKPLELWLNQHNEFDLAILFGSFATGKEHAKSDLDLAIQTVSRDGLIAKQKMAYIEQLNELLGVEVDLIDLRKVGQPLLSQIMKYGRQLKGDKNQYAELAIKNVNTAQDFMPYIKRMLSERRANILRHG